MTTAGGGNGSGASRIAIFGAGAVGSLVAARLCEAGKSPRLVARGARLDQLRSDGLLLCGSDDVVKRYCIDISEPTQGTEQDVLFLALKGQAIPAALPALSGWIGADTIIVPLVNGIPWWYFQPKFAQSVAAVDPQAHIAATLDPCRVVGAVLYLTAALGQDGVVSLLGHDHIVMGSIGGEDKIAIELLRRLFEGTPISTQFVTNIRCDMWSKVALNIATNPLSVVADATLHDQFHDPSLVRRVSAVLQEVIALARAYGVEPRMSLEQMLAKGREAGHFYTSMAQDFANGAPLEMGAIAHAVLELADRAGHAMPNTLAMVDLCMFRAGRLR